MPIQGLIVRTHYLFLLSLLSLAWVFAYFLLQPPKLPHLENSPPSELIKPLPEFANIDNIQEKKQSFFRYLEPMIADENAHLLILRDAITRVQTQLQSDGESSLHSAHVSWVRKLSSLYNIETSSSLTEQVDELLVRVNTIPASLVLAQAAIESGWGTSRFANEGNNLFGHWCFKKGCGIVPGKRGKNKRHEVAKFKNINSSIRAYLKNLNSFSAYEKFRRLRNKLLVNSSSSLDSLDLLPGLSKYSEQGMLYINKVRQVIISNELRTFDAGSSHSTM